MNHAPVVSETVPARAGRGDARGRVAALRLPPELEVLALQVARLSRLPRKKRTSQRTPQPYGVPANKLQRLQPIPVRHGLHQILTRHRDRHNSKSASVDFANQSVTRKFREELKEP